jgi:hypothetical protein
MPPHLLTLPLEVRQMIIAFTLSNLVVTFNLEPKNKNAYDDLATIGGWLERQCEERYEVIIQALDFRFEEEGRYAYEYLYNLHSKQPSRKRPALMSVCRQLRMEVIPLIPIHVPLRQPADLYNPYLGKPTRQECLVIPTEGFFHNYLRCVRHGIAPSYTFAPSFCECTMPSIRRIHCPDYWPQNKFRGSLEIIDLFKFCETHPEYVEEVFEGMKGHLRRLARQRNRVEEYVVGAGIGHLALETRRVPVRTHGVADLDKLAR